MNQRKRIARKTAHSRSLLTCPKRLVNHHWLKLQKHIRRQERQYNISDFRHAEIDDLTATFLARGNSDDIDASIFTAPNATVQSIVVQLPIEDDRE